MLNRREALKLSLAAGATIAFPASVSAARHALVHARGRASTGWKRVDFASTTYEDLAADWTGTKLYVAIFRDDEGQVFSQPFKLTLPLPGNVSMTSFAGHVRTPDGKLHPKSSREAYRWTGDPNDERALDSFEVPA